MIIEQATDAKRVNEIINDPSVYPWIKGIHTGALDASRVIADKNNVVLVSDYGCVIFAKLQTGIYEFHASVLPEGRGEWMHEGTAKVFHWMFTKTDAYELLTKCPDGNVLAKAGAKNVGCSFNFRTGPIWPAGDRKVPVDVYGMLLQHWAIKAPGLEELGHDFHEHLVAEYKRLGKDIVVETEDKIHDRYVGTAVEMMRGGQVGKAINFYNRWAAMSGYEKISVVSYDPLIIDIFEAKLRVANNNFEVL